MEISNNEPTVLLENKPRVTKAVILVGGLGTRFLPATLCLAKELFPIGNKPIILYHLEDLVKAGITDVLIVGNKLKEESVKGFFNPPKEYIAKVESDGKLSNLEGYYNVINNLNIIYVNQDDEEFTYDGVTYKNEYSGERGSAIAIGAAKHWVKDEPFMVMNGDDLCFYPDGTSMTKEVVDIYDLSGDLVVYGKELPREVIHKYSAMVLGDVVANGKGCKLLDIIEKPNNDEAPSTIMGFSRYILNCEFFDNIFNIKPRANGEWNMTEVIQLLAKQNKVSTCVFGGDYFDCGSEEGYAKANMYAVENLKK